MFNYLKNLRRNFARWAINCLSRWSEECRQALANLYGPKGKFQVEHYRDGKLLGCYDFPNGIVDAGLNHILGVEFHADTQVTTWYIGIVDNSGFSAFSNSDTMGSHSGWNEFASYSDSTRQAWGAGSASGRSITNSSPATFNINGSGTLKGIFVTSVSTKSGTTGTLWSTAAFASTVPVSSGDQLKVTYTVSG